MTATGEVDRHEQHLKNLASGDRAEPGRLTIDYSGLARHHPATRRRAAQELARFYAKR